MSARNTLRMLTAVLPCLLALCLATVPVHGGLIAWEAPQAISATGDTIVRTDGTLVEGVNLGALVNRTVNTVAFTGEVSRDGMGNHVNTGLWTGGGTSTNFQNVLDSMSFVNPSHTLTLTGLSEGNTYLVQFFVTDDRGAASQARGASFTMNGVQSAFAHNGTGVSLVGSFKADGITQDIFVEGWTNSGMTVGTGFTLNALQTRLTAVIPEPSTFLMLFGGLVGLVTQRRGSSKVQGLTRGARTQRRRYSTPAAVLALLAACSVIVDDTNAALLTGSVVTGGSTHNLTTLGPTDWAYFETASLAKFDQKLGGNGISDLSQVGSFSLQDTTGLYSLSWDDGTNMPVATGQAGGLQAVRGNGAVVTEGFRFTVPAGMGTNTVSLFTGAHLMNYSVTATLSDGSAGPLVLDAGNGGLSASTIQAFTIDYAAASSGAMLTLDILITASSTNTNSNIQIDGIALNFLAIPEPSTFALLGMALVGMMSRRRRSK